MTTPPPGAPAVMWSARGAETGSGPPPSPTTLDRWLGAVFLLLWRLLGLLALPVLFLHPQARRRIWNVPAPAPGWTWIHGASAGEQVAAQALADVLPVEVWRTSSSWRTSIQGVFPVPLDLPFGFVSWLDRARPGRLILVEAELWPGWLVACRARGIPVCVVNARPGRGTDRWRRFGPLWRWLTEGVTFVSQDQTGDLKLSAQIHAATFALGRDAFIAGSTRPGDEVHLLAAWKTLPDTIAGRPRPMLVLAPRHLKRVSEVVKLLDESGFVWAQKTSADVLGNVEVLLLDTMGEVASLYSQARAAFVGGTFDESIGGHSPAEPFSAGIPVVAGPYTQSSPMAWMSGIAIRVGHPSELSAAICSALSVGPGVSPHNDGALRCAALIPPVMVPFPRRQRPWLAPLVPFWGALVQAAPSTRNPPIKVDVPVVSVGALVAGGAGKTPAVGWLAEKLRAQNLSVWIVARGYRRGGGTGAEPRIGCPNTVPESPVGDELELLRRRGFSVVSCPDRLLGAQLAQSEGAAVILLDDGFQHRCLHRDLDVVCVDARWPDGRGPIPVGTRREPWGALGRAHWLWIHNADDLKRDQRIGLALDACMPGISLPRVLAQPKPAHWIRKGESFPLDAVQGAVDVLVGIARPEGFVSELLRLGLTVQSLRVVGDHRDFGPVGSGVVMTEKDAARLAPDADVWALVMENHILDGGALVQRILDLVRP